MDVGIDRAPEASKGPGRAKLTVGRVLVIDDSPLARSLVQGALEEAGFHVATADDGPQGIDQFLRLPSDVVVCDMMMPSMSGMDVLAALRERDPITPILIFTDASEVNLAVSAMRHGAYGYLLKGMSDDQLIAEVSSAIEHKKLLARTRELEAQNRHYQQNLERMVEEKTREVRELQTAQAQAEKMAALGTLVAGVAHEVNGPLSVVKCNLAWVGSQLTPLASALAKGSGEVAPSSDFAELTDVLGEAMQSAERIERIVSSLRRIAHPGERAAFCEVRSSLDEARTLCRAQVSADVALHWTLDSGVQYVGLAKDDLVTVVVNLVVNSFHAIESSGRPGEIHVDVSAPDPRHVRLAVRDNGCGIAASKLAQVWDPFFTTKPPGKGTGLGLSLVYQLVKAAGGEVQIQSVEGQGTTVSLLLPDGLSEMLA